MLDNIMLARTSDTSVRNIDSSIFAESSIQQTRITLTVYFRLTKKSDLSSKGRVAPKTPLENTFSRKLRNEPVLRFYEKIKYIAPCSLG